MREASGVSRKRTARGAGMVALAIGAAVFGLGCEERDMAAETLLEVETAMRALHAEGASIASVQSRVQAYNDAIRKLQPLTSSGTEAQRDAAATMMAKSHEGLALVEATKASRLQQQLQTAVNVARGVLDRRREQHALADAIAAPAPDEFLSELASERTERQQELSQLESRRAEMAAKIAELERQRSEHAEAARALRQEAGEIRSTALGMSARERADRIAEAVAVEKRANEQEVRAEQFAALIRREQPEMEQVDQQIERARRQMELLTLAAEEVRTRDEAGEAQAAASRASAEETAAEFDDLVNELIELVEGPLGESWQATVAG
ncbi:MAG: hypothetical protein VYC34_11665, partial [Planctomycetota bacterium]|nr:hypothetical protein [Planctomycetota bacterium]